MIIGGGTAGVVAAIAAARLGSKTLLIEQEDTIGGTLSGQLLQHISSFHDNNGNRIIGGIAKELVERMIELDASPGDIPDDTGYSCTLTPLNHEIWIYVLEEKLRSAGVKVLTSTMFCKALKENEKVCGAIIENHGGRQVIRSAVTIDCTGDAAVAFSAGVECIDIGHNAQALSMLFVLGNVDYGQIIDYYSTHLTEFRDGSASPETLMTRKTLTFWGFGSLLRQGAQKGALSFNRSEMHISVDCRTNQAIVNVTRIAADAMNPWEKTEASFSLRKQIMEFYAFCKKEIPGFQNASLIKTGKASLTQRESRRIVGRYTLTEADIMYSAEFPDAIAQNCFPSDRHDANGSSMKVVKVDRVIDIPYRCLLPKNKNGLLVAGRCISASSVALGSVRVTAACMAMGEAAGSAAAISVQSKCEPHELNVDMLKETLCKQGVILRKH